MYLPGVVVAYMMIGLPLAALPFTLLVCWMVRLSEFENIMILCLNDVGTLTFYQAALSAESMLYVLPTVCRSNTISAVAAQAIILLLHVFVGGVYIPWGHTPKYWMWLQDISIFTYASEAILIGVMNELKFKCDRWEIGTDDNNNICNDSIIETYECDGSDSDTNCMVSGKMILKQFLNIELSMSKWIPFAYLIIIMIVFRIVTSLLTICPVKKTLLQCRVTYNKWIQSQMQSSVMIVINRFFCNCFGNYQQPEFPGNIGKQQRVQDENVTVSDGKPVRNTVLTWRRLEAISLTNRKKILDSVSGIVHAGEVLAILGPSGSGATTLLNVLSNRAQTYARVTSGVIHFTGRKLHVSDYAFVPKHVEVNGSLSVREQLEFVGCLRTGQIDTVQMKLRKLVSDLKLNYQLDKKCKDLTADELKRVGICMGMIVDADILFLDEPTTGVDSLAAQSILELVFRITAESGTIVVMTVHQPSRSVFESLGNVLLLENGRVAFFGTVPDVNLFFKALGHSCPTSISPPDFYLDLIYSPPTDDKSISWRDLYLSFSFHAPMSAKVGVEVPGQLQKVFPIKNTLSKWKQFLYLVWFHNIYYVREFGFHIYRFLFLIISAIFLGTLFLNLKPDIRNVPMYAGAIFSGMTIVVITACASTFRLAEDRKLIRDLVCNGLVDYPTYILAQFLSSIPYNALASLAFQSIFFWLSNMNPSATVFFYVVFITFGHLLLMEAAMLIVVEALRDALLSLIFSMVICGNIYLWSGFYMQVQNMPIWIRWFSYIIPTKV